MKALALTLMLAPQIAAADLITVGVEWCAAPMANDRVLMMNSFMPVDREVVRGDADLGSEEVRWFATLVPDVYIGMVTHQGTTACVATGAEGDRIRSPYNDVRVALERIGYAENELARVEHGDGTITQLFLGPVEGRPDRCAIVSLNFDGAGVAQILAFDRVNDRTDGPCLLGTL